MDYLEGKSDEEIRKAATFWFMGAAAYQRGERIPAGVWLLSTKGITQADIEWAQKFVAEHDEKWADKP